MFRNSLSHDHPRVSHRCSIHVTAVPSHFPRVHHVDFARTVNIASVYSQLISETLGACALGLLQYMTTKDARGITGELVGEMRWRMRGSGECVLCHIVFVIVVELLLVGESKRAPVALSLDSLVPTRSTCYSFVFIATSN